MKDGVSRLSIRANGFKELNVDMVSMIPPTRMTLQIRNQQVKVSNTKECGRIIKCMEEESSLGLTEENIKVNTTVTKSREKEYSLGQTADATTDNGKMESSKDRAFTKTKMEI